MTDAEHHRQNMVVRPVTIIVDEAVAYQ